tara:strand:+ start:34 stop:768 length:735 start_codon:yes stop_codon:yes gene_type:complete
MAVVHQTNTFYDADPYNPLTWATHVTVTNEDGSSTDNTSADLLYDGLLTTFCGTNSLANNGQKRLIKFDREKQLPYCPTMKRPLRMFIRNFTAGSLTFLVDGVAVTPTTNTAAESATGGWVEIVGGTGTVSTWEVKHTSGNADVNIAAIEGGTILHCNTFDRIEFADNFLSLGDDAANVTSSTLIANTNTAFLTATWSSIERVTSASGTPQNFTFTELEDGLRGWIHGRRPVKGLQYPRGYYNT